jgi:hypothetical protein
MQCDEEMLWTVGCFEKPIAGSVLVDGGIEGVGTAVTKEED